MSTTLLKEIADRGLTLQTDGADLRLLGPRERMDAELVSRIRQNKPQLLQALAGDEGFAPSLLQRSYLLGRHSASEVPTASYVYHEFDGNWDLAELERALNQVIGAHESLRTRFTAAGNCVVEPVATARIDISDLRELAAVELAAALQLSREQRSHRVLPVGQPPLIEVHASIVADDRQLLAVGHDGLAMDGISMFLFFRAWQHAYDTGEAGPASVATERYLQATARLRSGAAGQRSRTHWLDRLAQLPGHPELPLRTGPAAVAEPRFTQREIRLTAPRWSALTAHAGVHGVTPTAMLLAGYAETLNAWGADRQFAISTTIANRPPVDPAMDSSVGQFSDVLLVAVDLDAGADFGGRAAAVQAQLRRALDNRHFSGLQVLQQLQQQGHGARARMPFTFNSTLGFTNPAASGSALSAFGREIFCVSQTPQVWLNVFVMEQDGELVIQLDSVDELFPVGLIAALVAGYRTLLETLTDAARWQDADFELLPAEQAQTRAAVNDTAAALSATFAWSAFRQRVLEHPDAEAVISNGRSLSYGELSARAHALAGWLRERGVRRDELVGLVIRSGPEQIVGAMAIALSGAAYLPIDATLPEQRRRYLLRDGEVRFVLTNAPEAVPHELTSRVIDLDEPVEATADFTGALPGAGADDLLYVLYTSGTTGDPKGVMVSHRSVVNVVTDCNARFAVGAGDRFFGISAFNFDLSVYDIFGALSAGASIVLPEHDGAADPAHWVRSCREHGVTLWNSVPAIVAMLRDQAVVDGLDALSELRLVMMSGDRIPPELPRSLRALLPATTLMSLGGPTETTVWNILHPITPADLEGDGIPYGKPNRNNRCHILDDRGRRRPDSVVGEICAAGFGLARGYWHDEERTAQRFFDHPGLGERIYRTGDLGSYRADGTVLITGRKDFQIKVNGYRIEAGEVETRLAEIDGIAQAAVARADGNLGSRLIAHLGGPVASRPADADIRARLRLTLPEYMVPVSFRWHAELPLTVNGKVDRSALNAMAEQITENRPVADDGPLPSPELEQELMAILSEVLHTPVPDAYTNFYDLGGSSLAAAQVLTRVRKNYGAAIALDQFYLVDHVRALARRIEQAQAADVKAHG